MTVPQRIYAKCRADGMPELLSMFIVSQLAYETAVDGLAFNSNVFYSCNNLQGYKWAGQSSALGPCLLSPEGDYYAKYASIEDSVHELTQWIRRRQKAGVFPADLDTITSPSQYAQLLKNGQYYGDTVAHYSAGLSSWFDVFKGYPLASNRTALVGVFLVLVAIGMYKYRRPLFDKKPNGIFV
jgi:hypothetical protein